VLVDVADYSHVPDGPGILLVGHGVDYWIDVGEGRPGLLFSRKRAGPEGDFPARHADALRRTLEGARMLEQDDGLGEPVRFRGDELLLRIPDRLNAPNDEHTWEALRPELDALLAKVYGEDGFTAEPRGEPRQPFGVRVRAKEPTDVATLLGRLG